MACVSPVQLLSWLPSWFRSWFDHRAGSEFGEDQDIPPNMPPVSPYSRRYANIRIAPASPDEWMVPSDGKDERGSESDGCSLLDEEILQLPSPAHFASPNTKSLFTQRGKETPQSTIAESFSADKHDSALVRETPTKGYTPISLDVTLLTTIERFTRYWGLWYDHNSVGSPDLLFQVDYVGGSSGIVRCGAYIPGKPDSVHHHFVLHMKICKAKELVPWESFGDKGQVKREEMLRIFMDYRANEGCSVLLPSNSK